MPIPNAAVANIPAEKLTHYLLNPGHPVGGSKADWFLELGYGPTSLEQDLLRLVQSCDDYAAMPAAFGTKYVVTGTIEAPNGRDVRITSVWIIETGGWQPRLVTAYPGDPL